MNVISSSSDLLLGLPTGQMQQSQRAEEAAVVHFTGHPPRAEGVLEESEESKAGGDVGDKAHKGDLQPRKRIALFCSFHHKKNILPLILPISS